MTVTKYSRNRFYRTLNDWAVPREYADVMFNYFVHGLSPGSFFTSLLANDFAGAMSHSHPANSVQALKNLVGWLRGTMTHGVCWGDQHTVKSWLALTDEQRLAILIERNLVYSEQDEILMALKNQHTAEPFFMD
jgi:hypothetical protein